MATATRPPALALLHGLLQMALAGAWPLAPPPEAQELCSYQAPSNASCFVQPTSALSCNIYLLAEGNCLGCEGNESFSEDKDFTQIFDADTNLTQLNITNTEDKRLLLKTVESWWHLELSDSPKGEHNITIANLPGRLSKTNPIMQTVHCNGCLPPRIHWIPYRKLHKFEMVVSPMDDFTENEIKVEIMISSTNETDFSEDKCNSPILNFSEAAKGKVNEILTIEDVYSAEFCFVFVLKIISNSFSDYKEKRYLCSKQKNMSEPYSPSVHTLIPVPNWWILCFMLTIIILFIISIMPLIIHKGIPWKCPVDFGN